MNSNRSLVKSLEEMFRMSFPILIRNACLKPTCRSVVCSAVSDRLTVPKTERTRAHDKDFPVHQENRIFKNDYTITACICFLEHCRCTV
ncbi:hypothetical protein CDAR_623461 [Caerostris darwini]|uniref:Uncharacterized protein n=1 Tax=Caerostris darwini TaxID=1538125 RepID=A0AAV4SK82_9ARAC|nr:hypothetical protein CDAR_623461 [Caerostris darwini]